MPNGKNTPSINDCLLMSAKGSEHVFFNDEERGICHCGLVKRVACRCECGDSHLKEVPTTIEERFTLHVQLLEGRLRALEQPTPSSVASELRSP